MKIKKWQEFLEDATANSTTAGMGDVVSAQPGALPGTTGTEGSGDIGFTLKKVKRKKGDPSEVTDLRDLKDETKLGDRFDVEEVKDID